jgi:peptidoglycan/LPS O-acetylase OafA/YrhL
MPANTMLLTCSLLAAAAPPEPVVPPAEAPAAPRATAADPTSIYNENLHPQTFYYRKEEDRVTNLVDTNGDGIPDTVAWSPLTMALWVGCQGSVFQFWNPEFLRAFGTGVVNGSLWTIAVEIQFYCATTLSYWSMHRRGETDRNGVFAVLVAAFAPINHFSVDIQQSVSRKCSIELFGNLFSVSCLPYVYTLLLGASSHRVSWYLIPQFGQQARTVLGLYVARTFVDCGVWGLPHGNHTPTHLVPVMGAAVLTPGYGRPKFPKVFCVRTMCRTAAYS